LLIIIIIIIMYCQSNFNGKYCGIFGPKIAWPPGDPDCRRTTVVVFILTHRWGKANRMLLYILTLDWGEFSLPHSGRLNPGKQPNTHEYKNAQ
jgi:hypothetical protein